MAKKKSIWKKAKEGYKLVASKKNIKKAKKIIISADKFMRGMRRGVQEALIG